MSAALLAVGGLVVTIGLALLGYLMRSSRTLGRIETLLETQGDDIDKLEKWQLNHDAEHVAYRNGYWEVGQRLPSWRRDS